MYNDSGTWIEVNESTNLSVGIYDMKWQVSGISDSANVRLYTTYEQYLNSSTQSYNYYKEGNFEENWELIISDWSCNIDFDFDLNSKGIFALDKYISSFFLLTTNFTIFVLLVFLMLKYGKIISASGFLIWKFITLSMCMGLIKGSSP